MSSLTEDLIEAERTNTLGRACQACVALDDAPEEDEPALRRALGGTIGEERLAKILKNNGYEVGRRAIARHREERHGS